MVFLLGWHQQRTSIPKHAFIKLDRLFEKCFICRQLPPQNGSVLVEIFEILQDNEISDNVILQYTILLVLWVMKMAVTFISYLFIFV